MTPIDEKNVKSEQDPKELELAEQKAKEEAAKDTALKFTFKLLTPVEYEGKTYKELKFDFSEISGADSLNIEAELNAQGIVVISPSYQTPYLLRVCARACSEPIDVDLLTKFKLRDFLALRNKARNFLMSVEQ
jgi:hypothetical protein